MSNRRSRILTTALICSVAINLLFIGAFTGLQLRAQHPDRPMPSHLRWLIGSMDEQSKKEILPIMRSNERESRPLRREMRRAQRAFEKAMLQDPLDEEQIAHAIEDLQQSSESLQTSMHRQMVEIMKQLNAEQRREALKFLNRRGSQNDRKRRRPHPEFEP